MNKSISFTNLADKDVSSPVVKPKPNIKYVDKNNNTTSIIGNNNGSSSTTSTPVSSMTKMHFLAGSLNDDCYFLEETANDCVYQITFKKVFNKKMSNEQSSGATNGMMMTKNYSDNRLSSQATINNASQSLSPSTTSFSMEDGKSTTSSNNGLVYTRVKVRQLKCASLVKFIEHLTSEETGELDSSLVQTFLATYRTFSDTKTVLGKLRQRYEQILPASLDMTEDVRVESLKSFRSLVKMWLDNYSEDFNEPPEYANLNELRSFVARYMPDTDLAQLCEIKRAQFQRVSSENSAQQIVETGRFSTQQRFLKNTKSFNNHNNNYKHHQRNLSHQVPLPVNSGANNMNGKASNHRRSYSNFMELTNESSSSSNGVNLKSKEKSSSNNFLHVLFGSSGLSLNKSNSNTNLNNYLDRTDQRWPDADQPLDQDDTFMSLDSKYIAEQLTYIDKCLFERVCAHHCLGAVWGTRHQKQYQKQDSASILRPNVSDQIDSGNISVESSSNKSSSPSSVVVIDSPPLSQQSSQQAPDKFASIRAFIDQFNWISFVVQATVLDNRADLRPVERARIIRKWIDVAQECRKYKNFSSLNAIVQGLNTQCVSRLEKTWNEVPSDVKAQFNELTEMFSQDQNQRIFREILMKDLNEYKKYKFGSADDSVWSSMSSSSNSVNNSGDEGTAKYADINSGLNATLGKKIKEKMNKQSHKYRDAREPVGTIPFLGTFLKDLEYIHAQTPTKNEKGQINVLQKRKEFEIIAQIKLLQQAAQLYRIKEDLNFKSWLYSQPIYNEAKYYELSYMIEPKFDRDSSYLSNGFLGRKTKTSFSQGSRSDSTESISSFTNNQTNGSNNAMVNSITSRTSSSNNSKTAKRPPTTNQHSRHSSMGNSENLPYENYASSESPFSSQKPLTEEGSNAPQVTTGAGLNTSSLHKYTKSSTASIVSTSNSPSEMRVKVNIENMNEASGSPLSSGGTAILYKKMSINDKYRTKDVKRLILDKFFLNPDLSDKYQLVQILDPSLYQSMDLGEQHVHGSGASNELIINDNCNVFYAAKNMPDMLFVLRKKAGGAVHGGMKAYASSLTTSNIATGSGNTSAASLSNFQRGTHRPTGSVDVTSSLNNNQRYRNGSAKNIYDQLPPQAPFKARSNGQTDGARSSHNWKFFKRILS